MKIIGIIGSIGAGKSTTRTKLVNRIYDYNSDANVVAVDLDDVVKLIHDANPSLRDELYLTFGPPMNWDKDDRSQFVIENIFARPHLYAKLVEILSPYIDMWLRKAIRTYKDQQVDVLIVEGVHFIHSEALASHLDCVVHVAATQNLCLTRVADRNRYTPKQAAILYDRTVPAMGFSLPSGRRYIINTNPESAEHIHDRLGNIVRQELSYLITPKETEKAEDEITDVRVTVGTAKYDTNLPKEKIAIYAGSFNPLHKGHLAVVEDLLRTFDQVILLVCINAAKGHGTDRRLPEIRERGIDVNVLPKGCTADIWGGAFVDYLDRLGNSEVTIARGIRNATDLEYETTYIKHLQEQCKIRGKTLPPVLFVPCREEYKHISSSGIKAIMPFDPGYATSLLP